MHNGISQSTSSFLLYSSAEVHDGKVRRRRTNWGKFQQVFWYAQVVAGIVICAAGIVTSEYEGVDDHVLARFEASDSTIG